MSIRINVNRFLAEIKEQGDLDWQEDVGLSRCAYSTSFIKARDFLQERMEAVGLETRIDSVGSLFGRLPGKCPKKGTILTGSHLDSVINGGRYDGMLGVFAALEAVRSFKEQGIALDHTVEVVAFNAEEGGPLGGTFGSRCFCGAVYMTPPKEVLSEYGLTEESIKQAKCCIDNYSCFLELHIEQGPVLDQEKISIGIPTGIVGISRFRCYLYGVANHAGTTPMSVRKDALAAAMAAATRWIGRVRQQDGLVCNVANIEVKPDQIGVVADRASFIAEVRSQEQELMDKARNWLEEELLAERTCTYKVEQLVSKAPARLDINLMAYVEKTCEDLRLSFKKMPSGASHDSSPISKIMPTAMIFVPSVNGISHSKDENTADVDLVNGALVLANLILKTDKEV